MSKGLGAETDLVSRELHLREWVRRKLGGVGHELRVARVAEMLFHLTRRWHELGRGECRLLTMGALVHDVGRAEGEDGHAKAGARMVMENTSLPLTEGERRRLAFMARHHRGRVPEEGEECYLDREADHGGVMRILLGLLRAADALDSRTGEAPQLVATIRGRQMTIFGYVAGDAEAAAATLGRPKKFRLLEATLGCEVQMEWFSTDRLALVS